MECRYQRARGCGNSKEDIDIDVDNITNACEKIFTDKKSIEAARAIFKGKKIGIPEEYLVILSKAEDDISILYKLQ